MTPYQPFAISNFRTGFDQAVEPWLLPRDAFQSLINCHLYRGVLEKINGYTIYAPFTYREIESLGTPDGMTTQWTGTLTNPPVTTNVVIYGTLVTGSTAETFTYSGDFSSTKMQFTGSAGGTATIDIVTGDYDVTFNTAPPLNTYSCMFIIYDYSPPSATAIMGIKPYYNSNGGQDIIVWDQKRVGMVVNNNGIAAAQSKAIQAISELPHDYVQHAIITGNGGTATYSGTLTGAPFVPGTLKWVEHLASGAFGTITVVDNGVGSLTGTGVNSGSINYVTGAYTITFSVNVPSGNYYDSYTGLYGNLFTGTISDFFSETNYQFKIFFTNNTNPIMYYDGISVHYLPTNLTVKVITATSGVPDYNTSTGYDISKCLHVFLYRERLLLISPTVIAIGFFSGIYWSTAGNPLDFTNDEFLQASTSQPIRALEVINTDLVVRFSNSERIFRYTSDAFSPFRWDETNNQWACDAPYSSINYNTFFSSVGRPAIVGSDGVNVKRVDEIIPDFTDPTRLALQTPVPFMNQTSIKQCYGERFDDLKEGWLCYNSLPTAQTSVTASDNILSFNYIDETYAIYQFPMSCLGLGRIINVPTWSTTYTTWEDMASTWDSFDLQSNALLDLGGDQFDTVFTLNDGNTLGDEVTPVTMSAVTKNFNPFIEEGQLCRFGYLDIFVSADALTKLRVQFYLNDQLYIDSNDEPAGFYQETTLTFQPKDAMSPTTNQVKVWKRIYVGAVGKEHTVRFYQNASDFTSTTLAQPVEIHAMVLWMKPAGRIFN